MTKLNVFNFVSLDGYYKTAGDDYSWHVHGKEENDFSQKNLGHGGLLLFGRATYDIMASFWPSSKALETMPEVAIGMNNAEKIVFSNTITHADWQNTRVISGDIVKEMGVLKNTSPKDMTILGSGSIVTLFTSAGLINQYQIMIDPVILGSGTSIFKGVDHGLKLKLVDSKTFSSGTVLLTYIP